MRFAALVVCLVAATGFAAKVRTRAELEQSEARLRADVAFLASDECEGRGPNTRGLDRAADYITEQMRKIGLTPGVENGKGWHQPFGIPGAAGELTLAGPLGQQIRPRPGQGFNVLGHNTPGSATGALVFVGYGIATADYDDYAGIDVEGKIVVFLRDAPRAGRPGMPPEMVKARDLKAKLALALRQGAKAALVVNDADAASTGDTPPDWSYIDVGGKRVPALFVRRVFVEKMLPAGKTLGGIERSIARDLKPDSFPLEGWTAGLTVRRGPTMTELKNIVGVLEGKGPLANQTVIVGAHYDHLGYGNPDQSLSKSNRRAIFHGADDNASGTAGILELARRFRAVPERQGRRLVFIAFSGEELGLLGSEHYCRRPVFPLADTAAMLNLDMIGRLNKEKLLTGGHGTAKPFEEMLESGARKYGLTLEKTKSGDGPSDHATFFEKKVPVIFLWTGTHADYHKPSDTADRVDYSNARRIVDMAEDLITTLTTMDRPAFIEVRGEPVKPSAAPRLGLVPADGKEGAEVREVTPGGPAERAGIRAGDAIVAIGPSAVKDAKQYVQVMALQKRGTTVEVTVLRDGKRVAMKVPLE